MSVGTFYPAFPPLPATDTEIGNLSGSTENVQESLDRKLEQEDLADYATESYVDDKVEPCVRYYDVDLSGVDLNNYQEPGIYRFQTNSSAPITNAPPGWDTDDSNFMILEVLSYDSDNVVQRASTADRDSDSTFNEMYQRSSEGSAWTNWIKLASEDYVDAGLANKLEAADLSNYAEKSFNNTPSELRVAYIDSDGKLTYSGSINSTELGRLNGLSSNVQDQLDDRFVGSQGGYFGKYNDGVSSKILATQGQWEVKMYKSGSECQLFVRYGSAATDFMMTGVKGYGGGGVESISGNNASALGQELGSVTKGSAADDGFPLNIGSHQSGSYLLSTIGTTVKAAIVDFWLHNNDSDEVAVAARLTGIV